MAEFRCYGAEAGQVWDLIQVEGGFIRVPLELQPTLDALDDPMVRRHYCVEYGLTAALWFSFSFGSHVLPFHTGSSGRSLIKVEMVYISDCFRDHLFRPVIWRNSSGDVATPTITSADKRSNSL